MFVGFHFRTFGRKEHQYYVLPEQFRQQQFRPEQLPSVPARVKQSWEAKAALGAPGYSMSTDREGSCGSPNTNLAHTRQRSKASMKRR